MSMDIYIHNSWSKLFPFIIWLGFEITGKLKFSLIKGIEHNIYIYIYIYIYIFIYWHTFLVNHYYTIYYL